MRCVHTRTMSSTPVKTSTLILEDVTRWEVEAFGAEVSVSGESVFQTLFVIIIVNNNLDSDVFTSMTTGVKHCNTLKNVQSHGFRQRLVFVSITNGPVCMCERGA